MSEGMRLQKFLSRAGAASRRKAEGLMLQGRVRVNGTVCTELGLRVDPHADRVDLDGRRIVLVPFRWIAFHKPTGVVTTQSDPRGRTTVYDHLPSEMNALRYVGRLDMDTSGLLLMSNQGDLIHRLTHPSFEVEREYEARVRGAIGEHALRRMRAGVSLEDGPARVRRAEVVGRWADGVVLRVVLTEGRNREVRRLLDAVGHPVDRLARTRFGPVGLGALESAAWRDLTDREVEGLAAVAVEVHTS